jgi:hypothetical protein
MRDPFFASAAEAGDMAVIRKTISMMNMLGLRIMAGPSDRVSFKDRTVIRSLSILQEEWQDEWRGKPSRAARE